MSTNLALANITATSGTVGRTLGDRWADVINVKDYGALGNGIADDAAAIQAAFNAAFGTSASPHGSSASTSNKAVFFPAGSYQCSTSLTLTQVYGGHIYGSGMNCTTIGYTGASTSKPAIVINGMENSHIELFNIGGMIDLDWDGTGTVGLQSNLLSDILFEFSCGIGCRIANSSNGGANTAFINVTGSQCLAVVRVVGSSAVGTTLFSGGGADGQNAVHILGGSASIYGPSYASNSSYDIKTENQCPVAVYGYRTESQNFLEASGRAVVAGGVHSAGSNGTFLSLPSSASKVITDGGRSVSGVVRSSGSTAAALYVRCMLFDLSSALSTASYGGNILQNI